MSHLNNRKLHSGVAVIRRELLFHLRLLSILLLSPQFLWSAPTPSVRISPDPLEGFRSSPVRAEAKAEGEIPRYLQWYFNGSLLLAGPEQLVTLPASFDYSENSLRVVASFANSAVTSATVRVSPGYTPPPYFIVPSTSSTIDRGQGIRLTVVAPDAHYQWLVDDTVIVGATNQDLSIVPARVENSGRYQCRVIYSFTNVLSQPFPITVRPTPPQVSQTYATIVGREKTSAELQVNSLDPDSFTAYWTKDGKPWAVTTNRVLHFDSLQREYSGFYSATLSNQWGRTVVPGLLSVKVLPELQAGYIGVFGTPTFGAATTPTSITQVVEVAAGSSFAAALTPDGKTWSWGKPEFTGLVNFLPKPLVHILASGNMVLGISSNGTAGASFLGSTSSAAPGTLLDADGFDSLPPWSATVYSNGQEFRTGSTNAIAVALRGDGEAAVLLPTGLIKTTSPASAPPKSLTDVVALEAGPIHFLALPKNGVPVSWGDPANAVPDGLSKVVAIAAGGTVDGPGFSVALRSDGSIVTWGATNAAKIVPPSGWPKASSISAGNSYVMAVLSAPGQPVVLQEPASTNVTAGQSCSLTWSLAGGNWQYRWFHNGIAIPGESGATLKLIGIQSQDAGIYWAEVRGEDWILRSAEATVGVAEAAPSILLQPHSLELQEHDTAFLDPRLTGSEPLFIRWFFENQPITNTTPLLELRDLRPAQAGRYHAVISNAWGAVTTQTARVLVQPRPAGKFITWDALGSVLQEWDQPLLSVTLNPNRTTFADPLAFGITPEGGWVGLLAEGRIRPLENPAPASVRITRVVSLSSGTVVLGGDGLLYPTTERVRPPVALSHVVTLDPANGFAAAQADGFGLRWPSNFKQEFRLEDGCQRITSDGLARLSDGRLTNLGGVFFNRSLPTGATNRLFRNLNTGSAIRDDSVALLWSPGLQQRSIPVSDEIREITILGNTLLGLSDKRPLSLIDSDQPAPFFLPDMLNRQVSLQVGELDNQFFALVLPPYTIASQPQDQSLLEGNSFVLSIEFSGASPERLQWFRNGLPLRDATNALLRVDSATPRDAGQYRVEFNGSLGTDHSRWVEVEILQAPRWVVQPTSLTTAPSTNSITLRGIAGGTPPFQYQWFKDGVSLVGANRDSLTILGASIETSGSYQVVATNRYGHALSDAARVILAKPPEFSQVPERLIFREADPILFPLGVVGESPLTIFLKGPRFPLGAAFDSTSITWPNASLTDEGLYTITVSNRFGIGAARELRLFVRGDQPSILVQPTATDVTVGHSLQLEVIAAGRPPLRYQWSRNGIPLPEGNSAHWSKENAEFSDAGEYRVEISSELGSVASEIATVWVGPGPNVIAWGDTRQNPSLGNLPPRLTNAMSLSVSRTHGLAVTTSGGLVGWGSNLTHCLEIPLIAQKGIRSAIAGNGASLALTQNGEVIGWGGVPEVVEHIPNFGEPVVELALGPQHALARTASGKVVAWGAESIPVRITGQVPNALSIAASEDLSLAVTPNHGVLLWGRGFEGYSLPVFSAAKVRAGDGTFALITTLGQVQKLYNPLALNEPELRRVKDLAVGGQLVALTDDGNVWVGNGWPNISQNFVRDSNAPPSLSAIATVGDARFGVVLVPRFLQSPESVTVDEQAGLSLHAKVLAPGAWSGFWLRDGARIPGANDEELKVQPVQESDAGAYQFAAYNEYGTNYSPRAVVTVRPLIPRITVQPPFSIRVHPGERITLQGDAIGVAPLKYQWYQNGAAIPHATAPTYSFPVNDGAIGTLELEVANEKGRIRTSPTRVLVVPEDLILDEIASPSDGWFFAPPNSFTYGNGRYRHSAGTPVEPLLYHTQLQKTGFYQVLMNFTEPPQNTLVDIDVRTPVETERIHLNVSGFPPAELPPAFYSLNFLYLHAGETEVKVNTIGTSSSWIYADAILLRYSPSPPNWVKFPPPLVVATEGDPLVLEGSASGESVSYQWSRDSIGIPTSPDGQTVWNSLTRADSGVYRLYAYNAGGSITGYDVVLKVLPRLHASIRGGKLLLEWDGEGQLQTAPTLSGPWEALSASSPLQLPLTLSGHGYFRLTPTP